jgi:hypothetical protein
MTLIDGDRIVTAQLYDDEHEDFTEEKMSIIDYVNAYTTEGVTTADDVLDKIRAEIEAKAKERELYLDMGHPHDGLYEALEIINKHISGKEQE